MKFSLKDMFTKSTSKQREDRYALSNHLNQNYRAAFRYYKEILENGSYFSGGRDGRKRKRESEIIGDEKAEGIVKEFVQKAEGADNAEFRAYFRETLNHLLFERGEEVGQFSKDYLKSLYPKVVKYNTSGPADENRESLKKILLDTYVGELFNKANVAAEVYYDRKKLSSADIDQFKERKDSFIEHETRKQVFYPLIAMLAIHSTPEFYKHVQEFFLKDVSIPDTDKWGRKLTPSEKLTRPEIAADLMADAAYKRLHRKLGQEPTAADFLKIVNERLFAENAGVAPDPSSSPYAEEEAKTASEAYAPDASLNPSSEAVPARSLSPRASGSVAAAQFSIPAPSLESPRH
jgi:hypothetical protein